MLLAVPSAFLEVPSDTAESDVVAQMFTARGGRTGGTHIGRSAATPDAEGSTASGVDAFYTAHRLLVPRSPDPRRDPNIAGFALSRRASVYGPLFDRPILPSADSTDAAAPPVGAKGQPSQAKALSFEEYVMRGAAAATGSAQDTRHWWQEWRAVHDAGRLCSNLTRLAAKIQRANAIADEFATFVTPIAQKVVEERSVPSWQKTVKPVRQHESYAYAQHGVAFILACGPPFVALYGSREGAHKAATNEVRAARTCLNLPFADFVPPLCALIVHMGVTIFASAPPPTSDAALCYGSFGSNYVAADDSVAYVAHQLGEFIPLERHVVVPSPSQAERKIPTALDVKLFNSPSHDATYCVDVARWLPTAVCPPEFIRDQASQQRIAARHPIENVPLANLYCLFRPEFMRSTCSVALNGDAGTPSQSSNGQSSIGFAQGHMSQSCVGPLSSELMALCQSGSLKQPQVSVLCHKHGVPLRYLGTVVRDVAERKSVAADTRDALIHMLHLEITARTCKQIIRDRLHASSTGGGDDLVVVNMLRALLLISPDGESFWQSMMLPTMKRKFDCECCPLVGGAGTSILATSDPSASSDVSNVVTDDGGRRPAGPPTFTIEVSLHTKGGPPSGATERRPNFDPSSLQVYHALSNTKVRVESLPTRYSAVEVAPGRFKPDASGIDVNADEGSQLALYPLIGASARPNSVLVTRILQLLPAELSSDLRGKRLYVHFKPSTRSCSWLPLSGALSSVGERSAVTLQEAAITTKDDVVFADAVEAACRQEITYFSKLMSESDPRLTLALRLTALAASAKGNFAAAAASMQRWLDIRRSSHNRLVIAASILECGYTFASSFDRMDRAETFMVEGLSELRGALSHMESDYAMKHVARVAATVASSCWTDGCKLVTPDRVLRIHDYLDAACVSLEAQKHPAVAALVSNIADFRYRCSRHTPCRSCKAPAAFYVSDPATLAHPNAVMLSNTTPIANDASHLAYEQSAPQGAVAGASTSTAAASATGGKKPAAKAGTRSRPREDGHITAGSRSGRSAGGAKGTMSTARGGAGQGDGVDDPDADGTGADGTFIRAYLGPVEQVTGEAPGTSRSLLLSGLSGTGGTSFVYLHRFMCEKCAQEQRVVPEHREPILLDAAKLYDRAVRLWTSFASCRTQCDPTFGDVLVAAGTLQGDGATVHRGVLDIARVYGETSHEAIAAEIKYAEVLYAKSTVVLDYTGACYDASRLAFTEDTLRATLHKMLKKRDLVAPMIYRVEISRVVELLLKVIHSLGETAAAKREHGATHHLLDCLLPALGLGHRLVTLALQNITQYYLKVATSTRDAPAVTVARQTAKKYGILWLQSAAEPLRASAMSPDATPPPSFADAGGPGGAIVTNGDAAAVEHVISHVLRDQLVKPLRLSPLSVDRQIANDTAAAIHATVERSAMRHHPIIAAALSQLDDVFRAQLKVVEETTQHAALMTKIDGLRRDLCSHVDCILQHHNRFDAYCDRLFGRIAVIKRFCGDAAATSKDPAVVNAALDVLQLHDELLRVPPQKSNPAGCIDGKSAAPSTDQPPESESRAVAPTAGTGSRGGIPYVSPYAFLPSCKADAEAGDPAAGAAATAMGLSSPQRLMRRRGGGDRRRPDAGAASSTVRKQPAWLPTADPLFPPLLSLGNDRPKSTGDALRQLFPQIALSGGQKLGL